MDQNKGICIQNLALDNATGQDITTTSYAGKAIRLKQSLDIADTESYVNSKRTDFGDLNENGEVETLQVELTTDNGLKINRQVEFEGTINGKFQQIKNLKINGDALITVNRGTIKNLILDGNIYYSNIDTNTGAQDLLGKVISGDSTVQFVAATGGGTSISEKMKLIKKIGLIGTNYGTIKKVENNMNINIEIQETEAGNSMLLKNDATTLNYEILKLAGGGGAELSFVGISEASFRNYATVGGVVGENEDGVIKDCRNEGQITITTEINANLAVGGIVGRGTGKSKIEGCINTGNISVPNSYDLGYNNENISKWMYNITNCRNSGSISLEDTELDVYSVVGGVQGNVLVNVSTEDGIDSIIIALNGANNIKSILEELKSDGITIDKLESAMSEIDEIVELAKINDKNLLNGDIENIVIQYGALSSNNITISLEDLTASGLSITSSSDETNIESAIETVQNFIDSLNNGIDEVALKLSTDENDEEENIQEAEDNIRDTDEANS